MAQQRTTGSVARRKATVSQVLAQHREAPPVVRFGDDHPVGERLKQLEGVGPEVPIHTTPHGGQHSNIPYRLDLLDPKAILALSKVLHYGTDVRGYPENNWRGIPARDNVNHALMHILAWLDGDKQDDHLPHAFTRLMFALGVELQGGPIDVTTDRPTT